jgi:pilus assembly protein CpaB
MGNRNVIFIVVAIGIALVAVLLTNSYFSGVEQRQQQVAQEQQLARIVVATQPLEFGQPLTTENLRLQNFPANSVPQGAFRSIEQVLQGGRVALRPIVPGEPVLADKVSGAGGRAVLAANLKEGMRAVSIPISATTAVSGFVRPGDTVDVMLTRQIPGDGATNQDMMTDVILERVKVLAIDQVANEQATEPGVGKTATVEVDLYDAQKLTLAERLGTLSLALRNVENAQPAALTVVTARDLGNSGLVRPIRARPQPTQSAGMFAPRIPDFPTANLNLPVAQAAASTAPARPSGPTMTIYRGVDSTEETVRRLGGL